MNKKVSRILIVIIFLAGLSLLLYPFVANEWNNYRQKQLISNYDTVVAEKEASGLIDYDAEMQHATDYNNGLLPSILPDSFAEAEISDQDEAYMACLNIARDGIMGTVEIPKINITLPIFHTTDKEVLEKAAGHLEGSSLPVGGESTHAVITAHRGLPSAALFTDLDKMEKGDHFLIHVLKETLCYEVDKITVVKPDDTDALSVENGQDLVTLLTCTPYGVNSHRMFVRGHRVPYDPEALGDESIPLANMSLHTSYLLWVIVGLLVTGVFCFFLYKRERRLRRMAAANSQSLQEAVTAQQPAETLTEAGEQEEPGGSEAIDESYKSEEIKPPEGE